MSDYSSECLEDLCVCDHAADEHGGDPEYPGSSACAIDGCDCVAYERADGGAPGQHPHKPARPPAPVAALAALLREACALHGTRERSKKGKR